MKKLIRGILPAPAWNAAASVKDAYLFNRTPSPEKMTRIPLPNPSEISLPELFGGDIADEWEADSKAISEVFEYADKGGAVCPGDRRALWYLIRRLEPRSALEIGTHIGGSTLHIAMAMKTSRPAPLPHLVTVDFIDVNDAAARQWERYDSPASPKDMLARLGCADVVDFVVARSLDYLAGRDGEFDFVFLDGSHQAHIVYQEIPMALKALRPGGFLLMHDYFPNLKPVWDDGKVISGPYRAVERLQREGNGIAALPLGILPWPTKLGSNTTSLALLTRL